MRNPLLARKQVCYIPSAASNMREWKMYSSHGIRLSCNDRISNLRDSFEVLLDFVECCFGFLLCWRKWAHFFSIRPCCG
jgi:hypothetical protein